MPQTVKQLPPKACANCSAPLERKTFNGRMEDFGVFRRRTHCSLGCARARLRKPNVSKSAHRYRSGKMRGPKCEACGITTRLQAHHCDGDWTNNVPENIQTLCIHCHRAWHFALTNTGRQIAGRMPNLWGTP